MLLLPAAMADDEKKRTQEASETNFTTIFELFEVEKALDMYDEAIDFHLTKVAGKARAAELDVTRLLSPPPPN